MILWLRQAFALFWASKLSKKAFVDVRCCSNKVSWTWKSSELPNVSLNSFIFCAALAEAWQRARDPNEISSNHDLVELWPVEMSFSSQPIPSYQSALNGSDPCNLHVQKKAFRIVTTRKRRSRKKAKETVIKIKDLHCLRLSCVYVCLMYVRSTLSLCYGRCICCRLNIFPHHYALHLSVP